jgi:hypothetical protein
MERFRLHEVVNTADGALIGNLFSAETGYLSRWQAPITEASERVTGRLANAGYTGPVCIDAFVWDDHGCHRLRPLVDLNARREISAGASALWRKLGGRGSAYWRFYSRRKIGLPPSYRQLETELGEHTWNPRRKRGILATAPLWLGPERRPPAKAALLFLGDDRDEVLALDRWFRQRFER